MKQLIDSRGLVNKLWDYVGPRQTSKYDLQGAQHWATSITPTDPRLPSPPQATIDAAIAQSRLDHYVRMLVRIRDGNEAKAIDLYLRGWQMESWTRLRPQRLVHVTPQRGIKPAFRCHDRIYVAAGARLRGGFSGSQRVMEYTYRWDVNGTVELGEPIAMPGAPALVVTNAGAKP